MAAKTSEEVQADIKSRFLTKANKEFREGSAIDFYTFAVSNEFEESYSTIENNKNPHIFSRLTGQELDDTGFMLNLPREINETDSTYFYRLMNWTKINEASNSTAIQCSVLNMVNASNAKYIPLTKGVGTGSMYIIPISYDATTEAAAIAEARTKVEGVATSGLNIDYIIPEIKAVKLSIYIESKKGDLDTIKTNIQTLVSSYINDVAPGDYMEIGQINKLGITMAQVDYFNTVALYINDAEVTDNEVMQEVESKLLFDEIVWVG